MSRTGADRLTGLWLPAVETMRPRDQIMQSKALARAMTQDGYIDPDAILPSGGAFVDFDAASHTASTASTSTWSTYLGAVLHLPDDTVWRLKVRFALTGWCSSNSNLNMRLLVDGTISDNFQVPLKASNALATSFGVLALPSVQGDVSLAVQFRASAGTLTIEAGEWFARAERRRG